MSLLMEIAAMSDCGSTHLVSIYLGTQQKFNGQSNGLVGCLNDLWATMAD